MFKIGDSVIIINEEERVTRFGENAVIVAFDTIENGPECILIELVRNGQRIWVSLENIKLEEE